MWQDLLGQPFDFGTHDCFALGRRYFRETFDIEVPDYARPHDWDADKLNLIELCYEHAGFEKVTRWKAKDLRPGDVLCMAVGSANPNHFAIYVGDNTMVHHLANRLSTAEPYRDFWQSVTCFLLRHPAVPDLRPVLPDIDITELLRERADFASRSE